MCPSSSSPIGYLPYVDEGDVQWGDFDADGDLDFAIQGSTQSGDILQVYRNDGGAFTNLGAGLTGLHEGKVVWTDYDADGYLDLLALGTAGSGGSPAHQPVPLRRLRCSPPSPRGSWG